MPEYMQEKILKIRSGKEAEEAQPQPKEANKENERRENREARPERRKREEKQEEGEIRMIKYWDGYTHKYSPTRLKFEGQDAHASPEPDYEKLRQLAFMQQDLKARGEAVARPYDHDLYQDEVPGLVHHSKQDGYFGPWFDVTNCNHHPAMRPPGDRFRPDKRVDAAQLNYDRR